MQTKDLGNQYRTLDIQGSIPKKIKSLETPS